MAQADYNYDGESYDPEQDQDQQQQQQQQTQAAAANEPGGFNNAQPQTPSQGWNREQFRDRSMSRAQGMTAGDFISQNQDISQGARLVPGSNDKVILPTGEVLDLSINADANGRGTGNGWTTVGDWQNGRIVPYADQGGSGGGGGGGSSSSSTSVTATSAQDQALRQQLIDELTKRAHQSLAIDSKTDPNIRQQVDPFEAAQTRAERDHMANLAESAGPYANLQGEQRLASERRGQATGGFEAELVGREIANRRKEIQDALTSMQGMLTTDQELTMRKELAELNDATQRYGISTGANTAANAQDLQWQGELLRNGQANNELGLRAEQQTNYWDALRSGLLQ